MRNKKLIAPFFALCLLAAPRLFSAEQENYQPFELDTLLHEIEGPAGPVITDDYIIFTAEPNHRFIGIAFDFEEYKQIHPFQVLSKTDDSENVTRRYMFYCYERQHRLTTLRYRLVIDGLWTTDPLNPLREYDDNVDLYFSKIDGLTDVRIFTEPQADDRIKFIYKGAGGQKIRLAGTFTNWDPWIYELTETSPGFYELSLPLTTGTYYYNYYIGLTPVLDESNPNKVYTTDGRSASVIVVD